MRTNPKYNNTCAMRIGMYREGQCTDGPRPCQFLDECDWHYDEKTGEWDYPDLPKPEIKPRISRTGRYGSGANHHAGASNIGKALYDKRWRLVAKGLASWVPIRTTLSEALEVAGL
jgi:hypothetical protein